MISLRPPCSRAENRHGNICCIATEESGNDMHCIEIERGELVCAAQSIATEEDDNAMICVA